MGSPKSQAILDEAVAILCITNEEFQDIVHQLIRNLKESATIAIDLDLKSMTLKVPSSSFSLWGQAAFLRGLGCYIRHH